MSMDESAYAAPQRALDRSAEAGARSLEDAIEGNWDFDIMDVMSEAWQKISGAKGAMWVGILVVYAATFVLRMVAGGIAAALGEGSVLEFTIVLTVELAGQAIAYVVTSGVYYYALKWAAGDPSATATDVLVGFSVAAPLLGVYLLMTLLAMVGFLFLILPGVYLMIAYALAAPLVIDRGLGVWEALETSRKAISNHWFKVLGLGLLASLAAGLGMVLTLGIGVVWAMPFFFMVYGVLYNRIFGYAGAGAGTG